MNLEQYRRIGGGTSAGTTAVAVKLDIGWKPDMVTVYVRDSATLTDVFHWDAWIDRTAKFDGAGTSAAAVVAANAGPISVDNTGFTIGAGCQTAGAKYFWVAERDVTSVPSLDKAGVARNNATAQDQGPTLGYGAGSGGNRARTAPDRTNTEASGWDGSGGAVGSAPSRNNSGTQRGS